MVTNYKIPMGKALNTYPQFIQDCVMKATAAETEYIFLEGGASSINSDAGGDLSSVRIGSFNYTEDKANESLTREQTMVSPMVMEYLKPTGLLYAGVSVHSYKDRCGIYG